MNWNGVGDFLAMGGYALYVWGSVAVTLLVILGEVGALKLRRTSWLTHYGRRLRIARKERQ